MLKIAINIGVPALAGFLFGTAQSFVVFLIARRRGLGTPMFWGTIVAALSAIAGIGMGLYAVLLAPVFAGAAFVGSIIRVFSDRGKREDKHVA